MDKGVKDLKRIAFNSIINSDLQRAFDSDVTQTDESLRNFPINKGPYLVRRAIWEKSKQLNVPMALVAGDLLSACSGAYLFNTEISHQNHNFGVGIYILNMLSSGGGKSVTKREIFEPLKNFQQQLDAKWQQQSVEHEIQLGIWAVKNRHKSKAFSKGAISQEEFAEFLKTKPREPSRINFLETTFTIPAIISSLKDFPYMVVIDDEGMRLTNTFKNDLYTWTAFWDGSPVYKNIKSEERVSIPKVGVVISVSGQTEPMLEYIDKYKEQLIASGFTGRALMSITEPTSSEESSVVHSQMETPCYDVLKANIEAGFKQELGRTLRFTPEAQAHIQMQVKHYRAMCDQLDSEEELEPLVKRAEQHIIKLAAITHLLANGTENDEIGIEYVQYGDDLFQYYLQQARYILTDERIFANRKANAKQLRDWLLSITEHGKRSEYFTTEYEPKGYNSYETYHVVPILTILQCGPKKFRKAKILNELLDEILRREPTFSVRFSCEQNAKCVYIDKTYYRRFLSGDNRDSWSD